MALLIGGLVIWCGVHLFSAVAPAARSLAIARLGEKRFKGLYALALVVSLVLIVLGWRSINPTYWYTPPFEPTAIHGFILLAFLLVSAPNRPTRLKLWVRHPMLLGVKIWAAAHLLVNGDDRTTILFGTLLAWAVAEVVLINKRDGDWVKPEITVSWLREILGGVAVLLVFAVVMMLHPWFAGVSVMGT